MRQKICEILNESFEILVCCGKASQHSIKLSLLQKFFVFFLSAVLQSCTARETIQQNQAGAKTAQTSDKQAQVLKQLGATYSPYLALSAQFVLKGKVDKTEILYDGILTIKGENLSVVLKDPVFRSPFFSLKVEKDFVTQIDHLRNKKDKIPFADYRWVELFGRVFPFRFFYPLLKGYPPDEIYAKSTRYETLEEEKGRFLFTTEYFDGIVNVENGFIASLYYRGRLDQEIVVMTFTGNANEKKTAAAQRYFPEQIYITRPRSEDYVRLDFKKVIIENL